MIHSSKTKEMHPRSIHRYLNSVEDAAATADNDDDNETNASIASADDVGVDAPADDEDGRE